MDPDRRNKIRWVLLVILLVAAGIWHGVINPTAGKAQPWVLSVAIIGAFTGSFGGTILGRKCVQFGGDRGGRSAVSRSISDTLDLYRQPSSSASSNPPIMVEAVFAQPEGAEVAYVQPPPSAPPPLFDAPIAAASYVQGVEMVPARFCTSCGNSLSGRGFSFCPSCGATLG